MIETHFAEEMEKLAWRGVYYHGTSPAAEKAILEKGFEASRGGTGGATSLVESVVGPNALTDKFRRSSEGRVALSRSKTLASLYAMAQSPEARARVGASVRNPTALGRLRGLASSIRNELPNAQPLEVRGIDEAKLRRDPGHFLLAVHHKGDIPASAVQKSTRGTGLLERLLPSRHPAHTAETSTSATRMTPTSNTLGPSEKEERGRQAAAQARDEQRLSASKKRTEQMLERQRLSR